MTEEQKKEFLEERSENVSVGAKIKDDLKKIEEDLKRKNGENVHVSKFAVRKEKYAQYTQAGLRTKHFLNRIQRYAFSLLKQDPTKIVIQFNGCITINRDVLDQKVKEIELAKLSSERKKMDVDD